jgi:hypothetical protein
MEAIMCATAIQALIVALTLVVPVTVSNGQEVGRSEYTEDGRFVVAPVSGSNDFQVYAKDTGQWSKFTFPEGIKAVPIVGVDVCTFGLSGEKITQLVAVDRRGNWHTHELLKPTTECQPSVNSSSPSLTVFWIDGRAYAFSSECGKWDSIPATTVPALSGDIAIVASDDSIAIFSSMTGKWAVAQTKVAKAKP